MIVDPPPPTNVEGLSWQKMVSPSQERWMKGEIRKWGLLPGTPEYNQPFRWEGQPLWRTPPPAEMQHRNPNELPRPDAFWVHPMFLWCPEIMCRGIVGQGGLPCITQGCSGSPQKKGLGRPRVVVGSGGGNCTMPNTGQYYLFASTLSCKKCRCSPWSADNPVYLACLPQLLQNLFPAYITYRKAVCRSLVDQMRRSGKSPADVSNEVKELQQLRYERANLQYLLLLKLVRDDGKSQSTLDAALGLDATAPSIPFGSYSCPHGYRGVDVSEQFMADTLIVEYKEQHPFLVGMMKGTFGRYWRSDHTRTVAKKVELLSGVMWSYSTINEFWEVVSWVMVDSDSEPPLKNYYQGLSRRYDMAGVQKATIRWVDRWCCTASPTNSSSADGDKESLDDRKWESWLADTGEDEQPVSSSSATSRVNVAVDRKPFAYRSSCRVNYNEDIIELLDSFHCLRRLGRACVSEAHPAYGRFMSLLSSAFFLVDEGDLKALTVARKFIGRKGDPIKKEVRRHCRTRIPQPGVLQERIEAVLSAFMLVEDASGLRLFTSRMLPEWHLQRVHVKRGCLSDPFVGK